jgi:hypothetical protein
VGVMGGLLTAIVGAASSRILDPIARTTLSPAVLDAGRASLSDALALIYWILFVAAAGALALAVRYMPEVSLGHQIEER